MELSIRIGIDEHYQPGDSCGEIEDEAEEIAKMGAGEWTAYFLQVLINGRPLGANLGGAVTDSGYEGTYDRPEQIHNDWLREQAQELLDETQATHSTETAYFICPGSIGTAVHEALVALDRNESPCVELHSDVNEAMQLWSRAGGVNEKGEETAVFEVACQVRQISMGRPPAIDRLDVDSDV